MKNLREKRTVLHVHWPFLHGLRAILPTYFLGVRVIAMLHGAELAMARRSFPIKLASELGDWALAEVQESFDWERITDEAVTLYRSVICKNGSPKPST